jgi:hypothetical protein
MVIGYPLCLEGVAFRNHGIIGIYQQKEKIIVLHCAFGFGNPKQPAEDKRQPNYILLDIFSKDFKEHTKVHLCYYQESFISALDSELYEENGKLILNTKKYKGFTETIAKLFEVSDKGLVEIGPSPESVMEIYNDSKTYHFGNSEVYMHSPFVMACRDSSSGNMIWKTKIGAYLYTEVKEENGILYFGTDGNGGKFFAVDLSDGRIRYSYPTGGTSNFICYKEYVLLSDEKDKPILLNRKNGVLCKEIQFDDYRITAYQQMIVVEDKLYAIAYREDVIYAVSAELTEI